MSSSASLAVLLLFLLGLGSTNGCFTSIFSFGDSIADTGNLLVSQSGKVPSARPPYGRTYFHRPTGRYSDGRLIIDFIAEALGFSYIRPFLAGPGVGGFRRGANFAVAGATALDVGFLRDRGFNIFFTNLSLQVQLGWFKDLLPSICSTDSECKSLLGSSLFLAGEIGGNDYNYALAQRKSLSELKSYIPTVIHAISSFLNDLIDLGAKILLVPGNFPIGCTPAYLTMFQDSSLEEYDPATGCLVRLNEFSQHYNKRLQLELDLLRSRHPHATIIYGDYYRPIMSIFSDHNNGTGKVPLAACCGGGGLYNGNLSAYCGDEGASVCDDPSSYVFWDMLHLTEAAYRDIAHGLLEGPFADPPVKEVCSRIRLERDYRDLRVDA